MRPIDADALLNELPLHPDGGLRSFKNLEIMTRVRETIMNAPTVDAVPVKHGRWVKMTGMMPPECRGHYECSECRWHIRGPRDSCRKEEELSYCPNCGAKMDWEKVSE